MEKIELMKAILQVIIFGGFGLILAIMAFAVVDAITPGRLVRQIAQEKNMALAILAAGAFVGISIIIAAAILA
jgi:putative membrane protein